VPQHQVRRIPVSRQKDKKAATVLILLTFPLDDVPATVGSENVVCRPDLAAVCADSVSDALSTRKPDVLITRSPVMRSTLAAWRAVQPGAPLVMVDLLAGEASRAESLEDDCARYGISYCRADDTVQALTIAERTWNEAMSTAPPATPSTERSVTLVGGGIVNLVTALQLVRHGYDVSLFDKAPDPRINADCAEYGCTRGGGDGRMFTLTEADSYNSRSLHPDGTSNNLLTHSVTEDGWRISKPGDPLDLERRWAEQFHRLPPWLANSYNNDIFAVNQEAKRQWADLMRSDPALFNDTTGYREGVLRLYMETEYFNRHITRNNEVGAIQRILDTSQVCDEYPALEDACKNGTVAGGIEVVGFTVNIHKFLSQLVDLLEDEGVQFHWKTQATGIEWAASGAAGGIETESGVVRSRHYVLSLGAYGNDLLRDTASHGKIQGMLGVWLTLPNIEPQLTRSVKIARNGHRAEETNVTLAADESGGLPTLICGAGYGWTGVDPHNVDSAELDTLFDALEDTLRRFFPRALEAARAAGALHNSRQLCVRPWTSSCLGVFERIETVRGGRLLVTGGHNTGGFTQSPVVAQAVLAAFEGRKHLMHTRYHPRRLENFYAAATQTLSPA
jgi:glycine/D-amino acid oxidase-like deaminating enzyme